MISVLHCKYNQCVYYSNKTKLDKISFSNQLEVDGYDLVKLDRDKTREVVVLLVTLKV